MRQPLRLVLYGNGELPYCSEVVHARKAAEERLLGECA